MKHEVTQNGITMYAHSDQKAVRLRHPTKRNCIWTLMQDRKYPVPHMCHMCNQIHIFKTFHLNLNEHGEVAVHPDIYQLFREQGIVGELQAKKEVMPRPQALFSGLLDYAGRPLPTNGPAPSKEYVPATAWQPPAVWSREEGLVKAPGSYKNLIEPPKETHRREPDGTWTYLPKEKK